MTEIRMDGAELVDWAILNLSIENNTLLMTRIKMHLKRYNAEIRLDADQHGIPVWILVFDSPEDAVLFNLERVYG